VVPLHLLVASLVGWLQGEQHKVIEYPREGNRTLKGQPHNQRVRLAADDRRRLATQSAPRDSWNRFRETRASALSQMTSADPRADVMLNHARQPR
jgi:hypothetical protein